MKQIAELLHSGRYRPTPPPFHVDPWWGRAVLRWGLLLLGLSLILVLAAALGGNLLFAGDGQLLYVADSDGDADLYLLDARTGITHALTHNDAGDLAPAWSQDGTQIAYVSWERDDADIVVMRADGSARRYLTGSPGDDYAPVWSPDGRQIAFHSNRDGTYRVYAVDLASGDIRPLGESDGRNLDAAWSPDNRYLAFSVQPPDQVYTKIYITNLARAAAINSSPLPGWWLNPRAGNDASPAWSPDGARVAFIAAGDGSSEVYTAAPDGSNRRQLTSDFSNDVTPVWSPDGTQIAFVSNGDGNWDLYVMNADGSNRRRVTYSFAFDGEPAWSPDGTQLAFISERDGMRDLYIMPVPLDSRVNPPVMVRRLTADLAREQSPLWRPGSRSSAPQSSPAAPPDGPQQIGALP